NLPDTSNRYLQLDGLGVKSDGQYIYRITAMDITQRKQAEEALSRSEARYRQIVETANEGIWMLDDHYRTTFVNWRVLDMLGYQLDEMFTRPLEDFLLPDDVDDHRRQMARRTRDENVTYERRFRHKNGQTLWMLISAAVLLDAKGGFTGALNMLTDITERKQTEEWLKLSEARYRAIVDDQTDLVCRSLSDGTLTFVNSAYCCYFGRTAEELLGVSFAPLIPEEDRADALTQAMACDAEHPIRTHEHRVIRADGSIRYVQWTSRAILDEHNALIETQSVGRDVTERKQMEEELYRLTVTDPLTGAFNRRYLMQVLDMEIRRAQRYTRPLSLIMFDLDHFKQINDTFGHQQGDRVLKGVATRVQRRLRRTDHFVRWGGEEFMILTTETARSEALALAKILHSELCNAPFPDIGRVTASFGVSEHRLHEALDEWLKRVDDLVYAVKRDGRNHIQHDGDVTDR
ncbi:MAG: PAS domain S-box protein, partial [Candidatus Competibacteraceae bacterium]|nr:PAS domain S-box protein [Candidatus Competibacteraceae bacterium]